MFCGRFDENNIIEYRIDDTFQPCVAPIGVAQGFVYHGVSGHMPETYTSYSKICKIHHAHLVSDILFKDSPMFLPMLLPMLSPSNSIGDVVTFHL